MSVSPSAFIPFCDFGGNMTSVGIKIDQFEAPVCNSFQAKLRNDQLCYEVDLNRFSNKDNIQNELDLGFNFLMDYNEDRQVTFKNKILSTKQKEISMSRNAQLNHDFYIYFNTIGKFSGEINFAARINVSHFHFIPYFHICILQSQFM